MPWGISIQCPKLTPLQARFAATVVASLVLIFIFFYLSPVHFAYAAEVDSIAKEDHNHHRLLDDPLAEAGDDSDLLNDRSSDQGDGIYEAEFVGFDRSIIGRQEDETEELSNNVAKNADIKGDIIQYYVFTKSSIWGEPGRRGRGLPSALNPRRVTGKSPPAKLMKRQEDEVKRVYLSVSVCTQPSTSNSDSTPPQLEMYVSTSADNRRPGPDKSEDSQMVVTFKEGYAISEFWASEDVYIGVSSASLDDGFDGEWNYDIAVSIDEAFFHQNVDMFVRYVDSDSTSALLVSNNLVSGQYWTEEDQKLMEGDPPFEMFTFAEDEINIKGISNSVCALRNLSKSDENVKTSLSMTTRGVGARAKEQFYVEGLNSSKSYFAFLAARENPSLESRQTNENGIAGGGGQVWQPIRFETKAENNCQMVFDLPFCTEVAYAVPANPDSMNSSELVKFYDDYAADAYKNFSRSLQQIPCNTTNTAQYSLVKNCDDCANDYKKWLCAVAIPRCEDFSTQDDFLQPRNVASAFFNGSFVDSDSEFGNSTYKERLYSNSSRSTRIDEVVKPGPYKELLPCEDHCFSIVKSCPAKLGFSCPVNGLGMEQSYGKRAKSGKMACNLVGDDYNGNGAGSLQMGSWVAYSAAGIGFLVTFWL